MDAECEQWQASDAVFTVAESLGWDNQPGRSNVLVCLADRRLTHLLVVLRDGGTYQVNTVIGALAAPEQAIRAVDALQTVCDELLRYAADTDATITSATVQADGLTAEVQLVDGPSCTMWLQRPGYGMVEGDGDVRAGEVRYPPPPDCPVCREQMTPIVRGYVGADVGAAEDRGEVIIGGCVIEPGAPRFVCQRCDVGR